MKHIKGDPAQLSNLALVAETNPQVVEDIEKAAGPAPAHDTSESSADEGEKRERYEDAMVWATLQVHNGKQTARNAVEMAQQMFGTTLSKETVRKLARTHPGQRPGKKGRQLYIDKAEEEKLVSLVEAMSTMKIAVYKSTLMYVANQAIKGTEYESKFKGGKVSEKWYRRWCKAYKHRLTMGRSQKLEMACDKW